MATTVTTECELRWSDGKKSTLKLPAPINATLTDPDTGDEIVGAAWFDSAAAFLENDDGASLQSMGIALVTVSSQTIYASIEGS